ncbi:MAG: type I polyketide synthase [Chloroflexota bacterium]
MIEKEQEALSPTKRALLAVKKLQAQVDTLQYQRTEPIAIVGMGCRFPGGINSPEEFWQMLHNGVDAIGEVPTARWNVDIDDENNPDIAGKMHTRYGGFLENVDQFDATFFQIAPREAEMLDPQQRLWLEVCWEALEKANIPAENLKNSRTGIFTGTEHHDYFQLATHATKNLDIYTVTGNMLSITPGRTSYFFGTHGPTIAIDTACSASLVAIHFACQSLRTAECDLALAGGVNLILKPAMSNVLLSDALASDGRCKAFSQSADGYGRAEGCGVVVLKRLIDAQADGDNILALIRGSAVNHDGQSSGLTVPNGLSQEKVIQEALKRAGVQPAEVSYVEAHGTGTPLGDPIEIEALGNVYGQRKTPLFVGSVKTNVGHLEAAAGVAGVIKTVLALQHREIPPHLHFTQPNSHISWEELPLTVPTSPHAWSAEERLAGVSSFSLSGTNAHMILQESPERKEEPDVATMADQTHYLIPLSAKSEKALRELAHRYEQILEEDTPHAPETPQTLGDICFTAATGRTHLDHRLALTADSLANARRALSSFQRGLTPANVRWGEALSNRPKIAFLFTGQGSQYIGMGRQLYESQPLFRQTLNQCDEILRPFLDKSLVEILYPHPDTDGSTLDIVNQTAYTQPALFTIEYALAALWKSWGIEPDMVMGHSVGEFVAASVAGVMSLEDSLKLLATRGQLMQSLPQNGSMLVVEADESQVLNWIRPYANSISIAAVNGSRNVVVSGTRSDIQAITESLQAVGVKTKALTVSHAFHSPLMEPMVTQFAKVAQQVTYGPPKLPLVTNLTGDMATADTISAAYWCEHIRQPVRFADGIETLNKQGCDIFLELGPKPVLLGMAQEHLPQADQRWLMSLREGQPENQQMLHTLGSLYVHGVDVHWNNVYASQSVRKVNLPTYPFQRQRHWVKADKNGHANGRVPQTPLMDLLQKGEAEQLASLLEQTAQFSPEQAALLPEIATLLVQQHQEELAEIETQDATDQLGDWFYRLNWLSRPRQNSATPLLTEENWLIFADQAGVGRTLAKLLGEQGKRCFLVYPGNKYSEGDDVWTIDPDSPADFEKLCASVEVIGNRLGVIHLWGFDQSDRPIVNADDLQAAQRLLCGSTLHLVQALLKQGGNARLWLATQGAVGVNDAPISAVQYGLWGLGRTIALEAPHLWGGLIDLEPAPIAANKNVTAEHINALAATLLSEVWDAEGEDQIAYRHGERYAARLARAEGPVGKAQPQVHFHADATYLITGGLGALGLHVVRWMIQQGAKHLVLTGRKGIVGKEKVVEELTQSGADVKVLATDVAKADDVAALFSEIRTAMLPLRGIIHAAGVLDDGILLHQAWARFQKVMAPKVEGAWHLYSQTQDSALDFLLFFSTSTSLLGMAGQSNYAAANAFMDALADYGQAQGRPTVSINWGSWSGAGMTAQSGSSGDVGEDPILPREGLQALAYVLKNITQQKRSGQIGVMKVEWFQFVENIQGATSFFSLVRERKVDGKEENQETQQPAIGPQLAAALPVERHEILQDYIQAEVAYALGADDLPAATQGFFDMGMDSLMSLQLSNRIKVGLEIDLPATLIFEYPSVAALTAYLLEERLVFEADHAQNGTVAHTERLSGTTSEQGSTTTLSAIEALSASELTALIDQEIAEFMEKSR